MSAARFEHLVADALDGLPDEVAALMSNVAVVIEDDPPPDDPDLLGLYDGVPLTERTAGWGALDLPDRVVVFRSSTLAICESEEEVAEEVWITIVHEVAHFHGMSEERIHELGWG